jgi:TonB family protein
MAPTLPLGPLRSVLVFGPAPEYPAEAKPRRLHGSGIVLMIIDRSSGRVISATMDKSTGEPILDRAALNAFRAWKFKPGTISKAKLPITFKFQH